MWMPLPPNTVINNAGQLVIHHSSGAGNSGSPVPVPAVPTMRVSFIDLTTKRKKVFRGLTVGSVYYFVFSAVNAGGASDLSDPVMKTCW
jgi:hypothetical protein